MGSSTTTHFRARALARLTGLTGLAGLLLIGLAATRAEAQSVDEALAAARPVFETFDVDAPETIEAISALGRADAAEGSAVSQRHARFVRAIAAADLVLFSRMRDDRALFERAAAAYDETPDTFVAALDQDLAALAPHYPETVADARGALGRSIPHSLPVPGPEHVRSQAAFFEFAIRRLAWTDPVSALAPLVPDPCASGVDRCAAPYRHFGSRGRRAVAATTALLETAASLRARAEAGDPFSVALMREGLIATRVLTALELAPQDWAPSVHSVELGDVVSPIAADALVVVGVDQVRVGWAPTVRFDPDGTAHVQARGPLFADGAEPFAIDPNPNSHVRPILGLGVHLAMQLRDAERVAIAVEPGVEAHVLSRVLRSAEHGRVDIGALSTVGTDGVPRGVPFRAVREEDPNERDALGVFVRMGGFSVRRPRAPFVSLPRIRHADVWRFDLTGLDRLADGAGRGHVRVRYMSTAPAELVLRAAAVVAPANAPVALVVP